MPTVNRHPADMTRDQMLDELRSLNPRATERAGDRVTSLADDTLREFLLVARLRRWNDEQGTAIR